MVSLGPSSRYGYWATRRRVLPALFFRDMAGGEGTLGIFKRILEPALMMMGTIALAWLISRVPPYGNSILLWCSSGVAPMFLFVHVSKHVARVPPVKGPYLMDLDNCLVTAVLEFVFVTVSVLAFFAVLYQYETREAMPHDFGPVTRAWIITALLAFGFGLIVRTLSRLFRVVHMLYPVFNRLVLHMSGVYFVIDTLPPELRSYLELNPLISAVTWFRLGFFQRYPTHCFLPYYLLTFMAVCLLVGLTVEVFIGDRIQD